MSAIFHVESGTATLPSFFRNVSGCDGVDRPGDDVDGAAAFGRRVGERVLELRPDALIQIGLLRNDVGEIEGGCVVDVCRCAIRRASHVPAIEAAVGVIRRQDLLVHGEERVGGEAVAAVLSTYDLA